MVFDFNKRYNREDFLDFLQNQFLPDDFGIFGIDEEKILVDKKFQKIKKITRLGKVQSLGKSKHTPLFVYEIRHESEFDPRVILTKEAFWVMRNESVERALIIFYSNRADNYRLSLMTISLISNGKKIERKYSNPHRYSFYLGPEAKIHTPNDYLVKPGKIKNFNDLISRFDVEVVTEKFYKEISNWYAWALQNVQFPKDADKEKNGNNVAIIRFITRLIFVWFMKQKKLIPDDLFNKEKIKNILIDLLDKKSSYYKAILQNLFFSTLNTKQNNREFREEKRFKGKNKDFGNQYVYRYHDLFANPKKIKNYFDNIPFLNGGLFECLDDGRNNIYIDGFTERSKKYQPIFPNELFFSVEKQVDLNDYFGTKKRKYQVEGLINILKRYNFTIDENTPMDIDIALDPELLGKVFENLLASYNPETATTARKSTGSYYTPRPIVHYMVDESLKAYFKDNLGNIKHVDKKLEELFFYDTDKHDFNKEETEKLIKAIDEVRIIDPAVGSGAFPMGVLQKLVYILSKLDSDNKIWRNLQKKRILKKIERAVGMKDKKEKGKELEEINDAFERNTSDYGRKLYLIRNCIYGVDIQPIAIQIAKLRFFISLLVDMNKEEIKPLPNLDFKFVSANTLISVPETKEENSLFQVQEVFFDKLQEKIEKYFNLSGGKQKDDTKKYIEKLIDQRINQKIQHVKESYIKSKTIGGGKIEKTIDKRNDKGKEGQIKLWKSYKNIFSLNKCVDFFEPKYFFPKIKNGFDIVVANPPYIQLEKNKGELGNLYKNQHYKVFDRRGDIYCLFYEKGLNITKPETGLLCYITSNKWMRAGYGEKLRQYLSEKNLLQLLDFGGFKVFENVTVDVNILLIQNAENNNKLQACHFKNDYKKDNSIAKYFENNKVNLRDLSADTWFIGTKAEIDLKKKIEKIGKPLKYWDIKIYRGILTGFNEAFIIDENKKRELIKQDPKSVEIIKPILRGKDIKKYGYNWARLYVIIVKFSSYMTLPKKYPAIYQHLKSYKKRLENRGQCKYSRIGNINKNKEFSGQHHWLELDNNPTDIYLQEFQKEKIVWAEIVREPSFAYDTKNIYCEATTFLMTGKGLKYLIAILNSSSATFFFKQFYAGGGLGESGYRYKKAFLEQLPIPEISEFEQKPFINLVDQVLKRKKDNIKTDTTDLEQKIDRLVYKLYDLNEKEIKIVEGSNKN